MTVPVQTIYTASIANGLTTVFPYGFKIAAAEDLAVTVDGIRLTSGYTVSGVGNPAGGNVTISVAPANGAKVVRYLAPVMKRETDYQQFGDWLAAVVNLDFDRIWTTLQAHQQNDTRSLKLPIDTATDQLITQDATARAHKAVIFDADGNVTVSVDNYVDQATNAAASAAAAATSASNASSSATAAAASASAASGSATSAATSATAATTQASAASTSATNAATSATAASGSATTATTQATNASNSATSAAGSATTASTAATNASNSATAAAGSATTASTAATNASNSATAAGTSATNAATSETNAAASAASAAASAATGAQVFAAEASIASGATCNIGGAASMNVLITGTTTITAFDTVAAGIHRNVRMQGALTLTNGAGLVLPGGANITTSAGDCFEAESLGSGNWVVRSYQKASGTALNFDRSVNDFRLTLTSATPVTTADVASATTIYCTPYKGNRIALYDGANWNVRTSAEFSKALGTLTGSLPYDVFCYDNAGTPTLEFLAWTNATTRATALAYQDGVLSKSGATTRRYLGTFYTTSTTTTEDSVANRYLWNYYNRAPRKMLYKATDASWTYTSTTFRQHNANAAYQLNFLIGVSEDAVEAEDIITQQQALVSNTLKVGIGLDATNAVSADCLASAHTTNSNTVNMICTQVAIAKYKGYPGIGKHYLAGLESATNTGGTSATFYGTTNAVSGMNGEIWA